MPVMGSDGNGFTDLLLRRFRSDHIDSSGAPITPLLAWGVTPRGGSRSSYTFLSRSEGLDHAEGRPQASGLRQVESYLSDMGMAFYIRDFHFVSLHRNKVGNNKT